MWAVIVIGVSGCVTESGNNGDVQPMESRLTVESQFSRMRIVGPGGLTPRSDGVTAPWLEPGNRVLHTNAEWKALWNLARQLPDTEPPMSLPGGYVAVATTNQASMQVHTHIRRIIEGADTVSIQTQAEGRKFPKVCSNGACSQTTIYDTDFIETLVVFLPGIAKKEITFLALPTLVWTPPTTEDVTNAPPCPYRRE